VTMYYTDFSNIRQLLSILDGLLLAT
jgi:hypothetical protein